MMKKCVFCGCEFAQLRAHVLTSHSKEIACNAIMPTSVELCLWLEVVLAGGPEGAEPEGATPKLANHTNGSLHDALSAIGTDGSIAGPSSSGDDEVSGGDLSLLGPPPPADIDDEGNNSQEGEYQQQTDEQVVDYFDCIKCNLCDKRLKSTVPSKRAEHAQVHLPKSSRPFVCGECGKLFTHKRNATEHVRKVHPKSSADLVKLSQDCSDQVAELERLCFGSEGLPKSEDGDVCNNNDKQQQSTTVIYRRSLALSLPKMECQLCFQTLKSTHPSKRREHAQVHLPKGETLYSCGECGKAYVYKRKAVKHIRKIHRITEVQSTLVDRSAEYSDKIKELELRCFSEYIKKSAKPAVSKNINNSINSILSLVLSARDEEDERNADNNNIVEENG